MIPPVKIDDLVTEWTKDCEIDETEPGKELIRCSKLHAKYLRIRTHHNLVIKRLEYDYSQRRRVAWQYYNGDLNNKEDMEAHNITEPFSKIVRDSKEKLVYMETDKSLLEIQSKQLIHQEIVDFCDNCLKEINNRTWALRKFIDWHMYNHGK